MFTQNFRDAFDNNMGVAVLRNAASGLDYSEMMKEQNLGDVSKLKIPEVSSNNNMSRYPTTDKLNKSLFRSSSDRKISTDVEYLSEPSKTETEDGSHHGSNSKYCFLSQFSI